MEPQKRSPEEWAKIVAMFRESGLTQRAYAEKVGVKPCTFSYWVTKKAMLASRAAAAAAAGFVRIESSSARPHVATLALSRTVALHFDALPEPAYFAQLARALEC